MYDITVAPLTNLWGYGPAGKLPDPTPVFDAAKGTNDEDQPMAAYVLSLLPAQRGKIMRTEIAIGIKAGTDAEKTTVPVVALKERATEVKKLLREQFGMVSVPYGKGLRRQLRNVYAADDPLDALVQLLEKRMEITSPALPQQSLPRTLMRGIMKAFIEKSASHLAGVDLAHTCRILGRLPTFRDPGYATWKLGLIGAALVVWCATQMRWDWLPCRSSRCRSRGATRPPPRPSPVSSWAAWA